MLPTQQGFKPANLPADNGYLRLINEVEVTVLDSVAHAFFEHQPRAGPAVHFVIVEAILLATGAFGFVHRDV
ncbi:hypothetical protein D3C87_1458640 [compost metagenome]